MTCLKCRGVMRRFELPVDQGNLWIGSRVEQLTLDLCEACGGVWFDAGELAAYLNRRLEGAPPPPRLDSKYRQVLDHRIASCPRCSVVLDHRRQREFRADACPRCGGIWLDSGEFHTGPRATWAARLKRILGSA